VSGALLLGLALGALGAATQIRVTRWRVGLALRGSPRLALATLPLSLLGPLLGALACAWLAAPALWAWLPAWALGRFAALRAEVPR